MSHREDEDFDDLEPLPGRPGPRDLPELPELPAEILELSDLEQEGAQRPVPEPPRPAVERARPEPTRTPADLPARSAPAAGASEQSSGKVAPGAAAPDEIPPSAPATAPADPASPRAPAAAEAQAEPQLLEEEALAPPAAAGGREGGAPAARGAKEDGDAARRAPAGATSGKRELDRAPLELRKASVFVLAGSIFPWGAPENLGVGSIVEKLLCFFAVWIFYQSHVLKHGERASGLVASLGRKNPLVPMIAAGLIALVGLAPIASSGASDDFWASVALIMEKTFLLLAGYTYVHIYDYERGGRFNPMFPLLFLFPAVGGLLSIITRIVPDLGRIPLQAILALAGAVGIGLGGLIACHTMYVAMKEAKAHGEARRQAAQEARRVAREARRGPGAGPGTDPPAGRER